MTAGTPPRPVQDAAAQELVAIKALYETTQEICSRLDLDGVLNALVARARQLLETDVAYLTVADERHQVLRMRACDNIVTARFQAAVLRFGVGLGGRVAAERRPVSSDSYFRDATLDHDPDIDEMVKAEGLHSVLAVPVEFESHLLGVLYVGNRRRSHFNQQQRTLLAGLGYSAAIAIHNAQVHSQLSRALTIHRTLMDLVLEDRGIPAIADRVAGLLRGPVLLLDWWGRRLADAPFEGSAIVPPERSLLDGWIASPDTPSMGLTALPIRIGESVEGYLVARPAEDDDALTQVALEQASTVFALELAKLRSAEHETEKSRGDLLDQLLASPLRNVPTLVRWAARLGLDLEAPCTVIAFDLSRVVEAEPGREWQRSRFLRICLAVLERRGVRRIAAWRNDRLVAVVGATPEMARDAASAVVAEVAAMSGGGPLAGVGGSVSSPAEVARSHEEALRALETARRVKRLGPVAGAGALDFHQLLLGASPRTDQDDLARAFLAPLETAGGQLPQTVAAYLEAGGNIERTAHLLSVHPNTVRNRVQRISELLGRDLTQADTRLDLHLALKVLGLDFR